MTCDRCGSREKVRRRVVAEDSGSRWFLPKVCDDCWATYKDSSDMWWVGR